MHRRIYQEVRMNIKKRCENIFAGAWVVLCLTFILPVINGCGGDGQEGEETGVAVQDSVVYVAQLRPLNEQIAGYSAVGEARFIVAGDSVTVIVNASGVTPGIMHLQHFHGFTDGRDAVCPDATADVNNDGIVDLVETEAVSGVTLVPFNDNPVNLEIKTDTYPVADAQGQISYRNTFSLNALQSAMQETYGIADPLLENRVVYIHGIAQDVVLPTTVESLPEVHAHVTLPVACGAIQRVE